MGDGTYERELVNAMTEAGIPAMRAPSSGSATDRELPDVLAGQAVHISGTSGPLETYSECWAIELKTGKSTTLYVDGEPADSDDWPGEAGQLGAFAQAFGATPMVGAKFKRRGGGRTPIYLVPLENCRETDGGNLGVPESDAEERAEMLVYPATENKEAEVHWTS